MLTPNNVYGQPHLLQTTFINVYGQSRHDFNTDLDFRRSQDVDEEFKELDFNNKSWKEGNAGRLFFPDIFTG